jgi:hypothetical protein
MKKLLIIASGLLFLSTTMALAQSDEPALDQDYRINAVMKYLGLTKAPTDPQLRANWLKVYTYITRPVGVGHFRGGTAPPEPPKPEVYLGTRISRLQNPDDIEQKRVAKILVAQPVPKERVMHYEDILSQYVLVGWGLQISRASTTRGVTRVTAMWTPYVRTPGMGPTSVNNPLVETWEVKGEEAKLVETTSRGDPYLAR